MSKQTLPPQKDPKLRDAWWQLYQSGEYSVLFETTNSDKLDFLKTIYNELYGELRDVHSRQQQIVAWGLTILTGGGFLSLVLADTLSIIGSLLFSIGLGVLTFALTKTIWFLSEDRMSIARQLDRMHQIMGAFTKDFYIRDTTLFDPIWYGWGFEKEYDVNWKLSRTYRVVLWTIFVTDVLILLNKAAVISYF